MKRWLAKVRRPGGASSVIDHFDEKRDARLAAVLYNDRYQTDDAYVEENRNWVSDQPEQEQ